MSDRRAIAHHEAAHAVVVEWLGRELGSVSIRAGQDHAGITATPSKFRGARTGPTAIFGGVSTEDREWLEGHILILLAGMAAERILEPPTGYGRPVWLAEEAGHDGARAEEVAFRLAGDEAPLYLAWLRAVSRRLVRDNWPAVAALATALLARDTIDGPHAVAIIQQAHKEENV